MIKQLKNSSLSFPRKRESRLSKIWISAFAGMTEVGVCKGRCLWLWRFFICLVCVLLNSCSSSGAYAPVASIGAPPIPASGVYFVKVGDTLYSIAWAYAIDYRQLAALNHLTPPYNLTPGQSIYLRSTAPVRAAALPAISRPSIRVAELPAAQPLRPVSRWLWPVRGRLREGFSAGYGGNPGIDISGYVGEPIRATAAGIVVYSGTGVKAYGNLIIIKHNDSYLSAYAYNKRNLVKQGTALKAGQVIATMGRSNAGAVLLHFEIRRDGQPVNPLNYLR